MQIVICDDIQRNLEMLNGIQISIPRRSSEKVQKTYMDFCRKEALK